MAISGGMRSTTSRKRAVYQPASAPDAPSSRGSPGLPEASGLPLYPPVPPGMAFPFPPNRSVTLRTFPARSVPLTA